VKGGGDGRDENGFRVKPGMTRGDDWAGVSRRAAVMEGWKHGFRIRSGMTACRMDAVGRVGRGAGDGKRGFSRITSGAGAVTSGVAIIRK